MKKQTTKKGTKNYVDDLPDSGSKNLLEDSELSYRSIFDNATDAIYIQDRNGIFIDVNPAAVQMYGYERDEMIGNTPDMLSAPGLNNLKETVEHLDAAFRGEPQRFEWWGRRKNGDIFPKEVVMNRGRYSGKEVVFAMARDVTDRLLAMDALRESEDKYRTLTAQIPVGVYRTTADGKFIYANPALLKMLSYQNPGDLFKLSVKQLYVNPDERERQLEISKTSSAVIQSIFQLRKGTGELIWVRDNSRLVFDRKGLPAYFDGILEDITEWVNAEKLIKQSEANLKAIIENTLESIWSVNCNYEIQYVNEVFATSFKQTFGVELRRGVNIVESLPLNIRQIWKERYDRTFGNEHFIFEDKIDINDATIFIEVSMNPIVIDGKVVGASMYGRDITRQMISQNQLHYLSDLQKMLIDLSANFINLPLKEIESAINQSLTSLGEFVGADRSYVFEYDFAKNTASNTFEWCRKDISEQKDNLQNLKLEQFSSWVDIHRKGNIVDIEDSSDLPADSPLRALLESQNIKSLLTIPLLTEDGCSGFVGFDFVRHRHVATEYEQQLLKVYAQNLINVKERLAKEKKLIDAKEKAEESDRLKSAFLANMSHEIRTPMNGIIGFLELLREPDLSEENKNNYIDIVTQSSRRLLDTINDIIEISKIEAGEMKINHSVVRLQELMAYYYGFFRQQTDLKGLNYIISNKLQNRVISFKTDKIKLESIISNLIKNAIKFTSKGSVEFGCNIDGGEICFYVSDTGSGIPEERLDMIFERFVQADPGSSRPHEGAGLGLSIVKAYIQMLGGRIKVNSDPGKGSTFTFYLPFVQAEEDPGEPIVRQSDEYMARELKATILIAEDDFASYMYLEKLLSGRGISFIHAKTGNDTVRIVRENPDLTLILMDIRMPGLSGLEATEEIRSFNKTIPIIAQTAFSLTGDREIAIKAGCTDYISKPVKAHELYRIINKYLGNTGPDYKIPNL